MIQQIDTYFPYRRQLLYYLVNSSERYKYVYMETPKVACSSIKYYLQLLEYDGDSTRIHRSVHDRSHSPLKPISVLQYSEKQIESLLWGEDYYRFTFVRNPYTRVLSGYIDKILHHPKHVKDEPLWYIRANERIRELGLSPESPATFEEFLVAIQKQQYHQMDLHWAPQTYLTGINNGFRYDFIGRFEHFDTDFVRVFDRIGEPRTWPLVLENRQKKITNAKAYLAEYYTPKTIALVQEIYAADFLHLGYGYSLDLA